MIEFLGVPLVELLVVMAFCLAVIGFAFWYQGKFGLKLWVSFLERSGYRHADNPHAPLEEQARMILKEMIQPSGAVRGPWVRPVGPWNVRYRSWTHIVGEGKPVTEQVWLLQLARPVSFQMQVLERSRAVPPFVPTLSSTALGRNRRWGERLRQEPLMGRIPFDDTSGAFDERFVVRTDSPEAARAFFANRAARAAITALPEAFVVIAGEWVSIDDPTGVIHRKLIGLSAITPAQIMERELPMHALIVETLSTLARALPEQPSSIASTPAIVPTPAPPALTTSAPPRDAPADLPGRVQSFRTEQGFGKIRLEDGREVSFDISHCTAPLQEGDAVYVQPTAKGGRLVAACVWTDKVPVPKAPKPESETRHPIERVLRDAQRAGLLTGVTPDEFAVVIKSVWSQGLETMGSSELDEVLIEYYGSQDKGPAQRDAVLVLPLYEEWATENEETGMDAWLSFCARELERFTLVTDASERLRAWSRENLEDEPEMLCAEDLIEAIKATFGASLDPRWRPGLFAFGINSVLLLMRDSKAFVELQSTFATEGALGLFVAAELLSRERQ